jgi:hypothetical protein
MLFVQAEILGRKTSRLVIEETGGKSCRRSFAADWLTVIFVFGSDRYQALYALV